MSGGLWRSNPATESQKRLALAPPASAPPGQPPKKKPGRVTQSDILKALLRQCRALGKALELPEIWSTRIVAFQARFFELRERGFVIDNELERTEEGIKSRYWLRFDPERDGER